MKNAILFLAMFFAVAAVQAQETAQPGAADTPAKQLSEEPQPIMVFGTTTVDYGTIEQGSDPIRIIKFKNEGDAPLIIKHAKGSCGCTVPTVPKEPIMPGEENEIQIRYDTKRPGPINKTVKITTNEEGRNHTLFVKGMVERQPKEDSQSVPPSEKSILNPQK